MATYKTPDVYVEEISLLPPSVAEVETAVPCFIGYTEKAKHISADDLLMKAKKVTSMVEFESFFGGAPPLVLDYDDSDDRVKVTLDSNNSPTAVDLEQKYYLYDSLRLFFDNGGGKCYIISVGIYGDDIEYGDTTSGLRGGLEVLKRKDEPTIIVFPDAVLLSSSDELYKLQQQALKQCADLMDRVVICDLLNNAVNENDSTNFELDVEAFRNKIGINNLKYGAAYTPWLKATLNKNVTFRDLKLQRADGAEILFKSLTTDADILQLISNLQLVYGLGDDITTKIVYGVTTNKTLEAYWQGEYDTNKAVVYDSASTTNAIKSAVSALYTIVDKIAQKLIDYRQNETSDVATDASQQVQAYSFRNEIDNVITQFELVEVFQDLIYHSWSMALTNAYTTVGAVWTTLVTTKPADPADIPDYKAISDEYTGTAQEKAIIALNMAVSAFDTFNRAILSIYSALSETASTYDSILYDSFTTYKSIMDKAKSELTELPPSGAIAGIYAYVDNLRGVFKAPANVSLSSVSGLTVSIDSDEQKDLNVDTNAGKSINAIRYFTGKGILVWGARTLAGNDNEWRYISVRRFYNMVEESIKKSTYWAVFEPNDANTWIRVKAMIENYLKQKWKEGALIGAVPDDAFFVKIGLGQTMTAQDVLEGRMNVEIGMAVVRPAEFIILKFSHFMQES